MAAKINKIACVFGQARYRLSTRKSTRRTWLPSSRLSAGRRNRPRRREVKATGACNVYCEDLREEFVRDFVFGHARQRPVRGQLPARHERRAPAHRKARIDVLRKEQADAVALAPRVGRPGPVRTHLSRPGTVGHYRAGATRWDLTSAQDDRIRGNTASMPVTSRNPIRMTATCSPSFEGGILRSLGRTPADMFQLTVDPPRRPMRPPASKSSLRKACRSRDGERLSAALLARLSGVAGANGVSRRHGRNRFRA